MNEQKNHCWHHLNIDITDALANDWKFPKATSRRHMLGYMPGLVLNKEWINMMLDQYELDIYYVWLFYSGSHFSADAHVDIDSRTLERNIFAMNWVINCNDSKMLWYDKSDEIKELKITKESQSGYEAWDYRTLEQIDSGVISDKLTLVRVDTPHRTVSTIHKRWCISVRAKNSNLKTWDSVVEHFKSKNSLIARL
jgi:hypothetical protein